MVVVVCGGQPERGGFSHGARVCYRLDSIFVSSFIPYSQAFRLIPLSCNTVTVFIGRLPTAIGCQGHPTVLEA